MGARLNHHYPRKEADGWYVNLSLENTSSPSSNYRVIPTAANTIGIDARIEKGFW